MEIYSTYSNQVFENDIWNLYPLGPQNDLDITFLDPQRFLCDEQPLFLKPIDTIGFNNDCSHICDNAFPIIEKIVPSESEASVKVIEPIKTDENEYVDIETIDENEDCQDESEDNNETMNNIFEQNTFEIDLMKMYNRGKRKLTKITTLGEMIKCDYNLESETFRFDQALDYIQRKAYVHEKRKIYPMLKLLPNTLDTKSILNINVWYFFVTKKDMKYEQLIKEKLELPDLFEKEDKKAWKKSEIDLSSPIDKQQGFFSILFCIFFSKTEKKNTKDYVEFILTNPFRLVNRATDCKRLRGTIESFSKKPKFT